MFELSEITKREDYSVWFRRRGTSDFWDVFTKTGDLIAKYNDNLVKSSEDMLVEFADNYEGTCTQHLVIKEFQLFKSTRPEYLVGNYVEIADDLESKATNSIIYDKVLAGAMLLQADSDEIIPRVERCLNWLHSTDFYSAPGSTIYHDSEVGGLLKHSLRVVNKIVELIDIPTFTGVNIAEAILVALSHDWCKIGLYEQYMRNVKNELTGKWEAVPSFRRKDSACPFGHGTSSMFIAQKLLRLSTEMSLAIRWHMGRWNVVDSEVNDLQYSNENYPLVHLIQFADQLSITKY